MAENPNYKELKQRVSDLEQQNEQLQSEATKYRILFDTFPHGITVSDSHGNILEANSVSEQLLGIEKDEHQKRDIAGQEWRIIRKDGNDMPPEEWASVIALKENCLVTDCEMGIVKPDGQTIWLNVTAAPIPLEGFGVVITYKDNTERENAQKRLRESEKRYKEIFHNKHVPMLVINSETGSIINANPASTKLYGWSHSELTEMNIKDINTLPEDDVTNAMQKTKNRRGRLFHFQHRLKDGSIRDMEVISAPVEYGKKTNLFSIIFDITERKNHEILLEKKNIDLKLVQRIASIGVWTLDPEVGVPEWSEEIYRIYERDPSLGPYLLEEYKNIYKGKLWEKFYSVIQGAITDGTPYDIELKLEFPSGKKKWIHAICEPESKIGPKGHKVRGTIQDITEKKITEKKLRQSQKMESIGTLAGGIAHEFNNMLGIIIGNTELALDDIPEWNPAANSIQEIRTASLRAKDVVQKLLSVARKTPESRKPMQIRTIVDESLGLLRRTIPVNIEIISNLACTTETILGDPTEISQVLINLCTNSAHAMIDGKGFMEVTLETKTFNSLSVEHFANIGPGDYVKLTVSDNGEGIAQNILDHIFEPYFTTKDVDKGLGMGLAVVDGIIKKHEGEITVKSEVGKGTTVEVLFPLIHEKPIHSGEETETSKTGTERILFVDDEASLVRMVTQMLTRSGYEVVGKTNSQEALDLFKKSSERFDLVITDMAMPEITGEELAKQIIQVRPDIPIILCTGHSERMDENRAMELGIKSFAMKPLGKADLINTVRNVLDDAKSGS